DGIRDFHVTGVQTCGLPIFIIKDLAKEEEIIDVKANERALELLGDFTKQITEDLKHTMMQTVSELTKTISSLQQEIQTLKQNNRSEERRAGKEPRDPRDDNE